MVLTLADRLVLGAAFVQLMLTVLLMVWTGILRVGAVRSRTVRLKDIALSGEKYPERARQVANSYANQFQLPILFYFTIVVILTTGGADTVGAVLAWLFVLLRIVHMSVHTTSNDLNVRFFSFLAGAIVLSLFILWAFVPLFMPGVA